MAYYYYQINEKEKWRVSEATQKNLQKIKDSGARRMSILSVNQPVEEDTDENKIRYQGPFYIDIDSSDLQVSIDSAKDLLNKIDQENIPRESVEIYCSGKKGFHFYFHL